MQQKQHGQSQRQSQQTSSPPGADRGVGAADPGKPGGSPHQPNADHGYGTGVQAEDLHDDTRTYGDDPGEFDFNQRHDDDSAAAEAPVRNKPANNEERQGQQAGDKGPSGDTGVFGSHAPFGKPEAIDSQISQSDTRSERH